jgi:hypothetical protein
MTGHFQGEFGDGHPPSVVAASDEPGLHGACVFCADPRQPEDHDGPCTEFTSDQLDALEGKWLTNVTEESLQALQSFLGSLRHNRGGR